MEKFQKNLARNLRIFKIGPDPQKRASFLVNVNLYFCSTFKQKNEMGWNTVLGILETWFTKKLKSFLLV